MTDLYMIPTYATLGKKTAQQLIAQSEIIKTNSNDYYIRVGGYDLMINDDNNMVVSGYGTAICNMILSADDYHALNAKADQVEQNYQRDQLLFD